MVNASSSGSPHRGAFSLGGTRESIAILILLVFFSRLGPTFHPLLLAVVIGVGFYWYLRIADYLFGRIGRRVAVSTVLLGITWLGVAQYLAYLRYENLLVHLNQYDEITIRKSGLFPSSPVEQISFKNSADDDLVEKIVQFPEFVHVSDVYLKSTNITDRGLSALDQFPKLNYVYIDAPAISEEGVEAFEKRHPQCRVIVRNGNYLRGKAQKQD